MLLSLKIAVKSKINLDDLMYQVTLSYLHITLLAPNTFWDRTTILYVFIAVSLLFYPKEETCLRHLYL